MQTEIPQPPDSNSPPSHSPGLEIELADRIQRRRKELGITPSEPKSLDFSKLRMFSMPEVDEAAEAAAEAKRAQDDERAERARRIASWRNLCVGECQAYEAATVDSYVISNDKATAAVQRSVRDGVAEYIETLPERVRNGDGFLFYGPCGTGKDHLAMAICRAAVLDHGFSVVRINGSEWYGRLRDLMGQESSSEANEIASLARPALLLISDPAPPIGDLTQYQASMLYRVLEKRQANGKGTLVTANVEGAADAAKRLGAATMDRMRFKSWAAACNWKSYRKPSRTFGE